MPTVRGHGMIALIAAGPPPKQAANVIYRKLARYSSQATQGRDADSGEAYGDRLGL